LSSNFDFIKETYPPFFAETNLMGCLREAKAPLLYKYFPPLLLKERGIKGGEVSRKIKSPEVLKPRGFS
jgi:hypothetical protein